MNRAGAGVAVVKLGGSHALGAYLREWVAAIAAEAGAVVVVPGGGPFADAVRAAQGPMGFDDDAAHDMALMAMCQFGRALQGLDPRFQPSGSIAAIRRALAGRRVPVWSPYPMARAPNFSGTWDLTSDSLAAWLARKLGARRLVLVKHGRFHGRSVALTGLVADGVVDPLFPVHLGQGPLAVLLAAPADASRLRAGLRGREFPEIVRANEPAQTFEPAAE